MKHVQSMRNRPNEFFSKPKDHPQSHFVAQKQMRPEGCHGQHTVMGQTIQWDQDDKNTKVRGHSQPSKGDSKIDTDLLLIKMSTAVI